MREVDLDDEPARAFEVVELAVLREVGPNDLIVLRFKEKVSPEVSVRLREGWARMTEGHPASRCKLVILDGGVELSVLRFSAST